MLSMCGCEPVGVDLKADSERYGENYESFFRGYTISLKKIYTAYMRDCVVACSSYGRSAALIGERESD